VTQPFRCDGAHLFVNADAQGGSLDVEVLDEKGNLLAGFDAESCRKISTDTLVAEDGAWVQWNGESTLRQLNGRQIQLRFRLQNARLYSCRVADEKSRPVPRATRN
jgi:hypothetical protein